MVSWSICDSGQTSLHPLRKSKPDRSQQLIHLAIPQMIPRDSLLQSPPILRSPLLTGHLLTIPALNPVIHKPPRPTPPLIERRKGRGPILIRQAITLRQLMDFLIPEQVSAGTSWGDIPARHLCHGLRRTYAHVITSLSSVDFGKAFEEEWQRRKSELVNADWFVPLVLWGSAPHCRKCSFTGQYGQIVLVSFYMSR